MCFAAACREGSRLEGWQLEGGADSKWEGGESDEGDMR